MKSLTAVNRGKELVSLTENKIDLMSLSYDHDNLRRNRPFLFKELFNAAEEGQVWKQSIDGVIHLTVPIHSDFLLFKMKHSSEYYEIRNKKMFRKASKPSINWKLLRETAKKTKSMSNSELNQYKDAQVTFFSLFDLLGRKDISEITLDLLTNMREAGIQQVYEKKFKMESHRVFLEFGKLLETADPSDNFYEDLKMNYDKSKKAYHDAAVEYLEELHRFQKEFRQQEHLKVLSLVQETGE